MAQSVEALVGRAQVAGLSVGSASTFSPFFLNHLPPLIKK